jgi:tetratricopeptide (TPR) repeat protein
VNNLALRKRLYLGIAFGLIIVLALVFLVWGNTWRMSVANKYYHKADYDRAQERYENLLVDMANSPYVLNNLGLSLLKKEQNDKAIVNLKDAISGLEGLAVGKSRKDKLKNELHYNLGNTLYGLAEKSQDQQGQVGYGQALENFKQAIEANPKDMDAKYNYELTLLRLKQPPPNKPPEQQQNEAENIVNMNDAQYFIPKIRDEEPVVKDW